MGGAIINPKCPFTIVCDTRETIPYTFECIKPDVSQGIGRLIVPTMRLALETGDYAVFGLPGYVIERKTLADLYASIGKRSNFVGRLERMNAQQGAVVVEAEFSEVLGRPPKFTKRRPKTVSRTIIAWSQRYPRVAWYFLPGREWSEAFVFRLLERWWKDHQVKT